MSDVYQQSIDLHRANKGKIRLTSVVPVTSKEDLSLVYTPGVAGVSRAVVADPDESFALTWRGRTVAVISDGSAVLGLGNVGPEAAIPVMEGKAMLIERFGGLSAVPIVTHAHTEDELVDFVTKIAPSFGAINLEDIASPICLGVEDRLQDLGIPVFHDDQHGTAVVVMAAIHNAAKVVGKEYRDLTVVISGAGSAGLAIAQILLGYERKNGMLEKFGSSETVKDVRLVDSTGIIERNRVDLDGWKKQFADISNTKHINGGLGEAVREADVFVGVSRGGILTSDMVRSMASDAIVFAMANPDPEILPDEARKAGAAIVGTGRSDYPNQINNSLAFPGIFKGALEAHATKITRGMMQRASEALAAMVSPTHEQVLPGMFDSGTAEAIAQAVAEQAQIESVIR